MDASRTVPRTYARLIPVPEIPPALATAWLVAMVEGTAAELLRPFLAPGESTVGVSIWITHTSPTPAGLDVTVRVRLVEVDGRRLTFDADCWDAIEAIGHAHHERMVIDVERFTARLRRKASAARSGREPAANSPPEQDSGGGG
jgi:fluoroacetyl-CoA thioesterase